MDTKEQYSDKTIFTRMCISEAIIDLMGKKPFDKITVSEVVKRAGVARMTFYNYYHSTYEALSDYLQILIKEYIAEGESNPEIGGNRTYSHILFSLEFFDRHAPYFMMLSQNGLHTIMLDGINRFMQYAAMYDANHSVYEMYCYSGGLLNTFLKWEEGGKKEKVEDIAGLLYKLYNH